MKPRDVMDSPVIQTLDVGRYIRGVSIRTAEDAARLADLRDRLNRWRLTSILLAVIVSLPTAAWMTTA
jgi:hypothetical protein